MSAEDELPASILEEMGISNVSGIELTVLSVLNINKTFIYIPRYCSQCLKQNIARIHDRDFLHNKLPGKRSNEGYIVNGITFNTQV